MMSKYVLIETYWNVNYIDTSTQSSKVIVLIETYWNVNICKEVFEYAYKTS